MKAFPTASSTDLFDSQVNMSERKTKPLCGCGRGHGLTGGLARRRLTFFQPDSASRARQGSTKPEACSRQFAEERSNPVKHLSGLRHRSIVHLVEGLKDFGREQRRSTDVGAPPPTTHMGSLSQLQVGASGDSSGSKDGQARFVGVRS